jgi:hypothetical protein
MLPDVGSLLAAQAASSNPPDMDPTVKKSVQPQLPPAGADALNRLVALQLRVAYTPMHSRLNFSSR